MSKAQLFFWIMWVNTISFFIEVFSGFVIWLDIPYGNKGVFIVDQLTWISVHKWGAITIAVFVLIHVLLHWKWIARQIKSSIKIRIPDISPSPKGEPVVVRNVDTDMD